MESFFSFLEKRVDDCSSLLCIGLDPHTKDLPAPTAGMPNLRLKTWMWTASR